MKSHENNENYKPIVILYNLFEKVLNSRHVAFPKNNNKNNHRILLKINNNVEIVNILYLVISQIQ